MGHRGDRGATVERLGAGQGDHEEPGSEKSLFENPEDKVQVPE